MNLDEALNRLQGVQKKDGQYLAYCPAHDDKKPSLSVKDDTESLVMNCFAGCEFEDIIAKLKDGYIAPASPMPANEEPEKVVAVYDYHNEANEVVYSVQRTNLKNFWQKKPNGESIGNTKRVLYHLPQLIKSEVCFLVEGEKDVLALEELGLVASTVSGGANTSNWKPDFAQYFKGKKIVLIPDNDPTGIKFMKHVANELLSVTDKVKLLELPELEVKQDVSDWLAKGNSKKQLLEFVSKAPRWEKTENETLQNATQNTQKGVADNKTRVVVNNIAYIAEQNHKTLIPFHKNHLPDYPLEVLPSAIADYVKSVARELSAHQDLAANAVLPIVGATVQKKYGVKFKTGLFHLNAYAVSIGESGEGKSPSDNKMMMPLHEFEREEQKNKRADISAHNADIEILEKEFKHLSDKAAKEDEHDKRQSFREQAKAVAEELTGKKRKHELQMFVDDVTAEGLAKYLMEQGERGLCFSSEGDLFGVMIGRYGNGANFRIWLDSYDGNPIRYNRRRGKPIILDSPLMSLSLSMQPSVLYEEISKTKSLTDRGLVARALWAWPQGTLGYQEENDYSMSEEVETSYKTLVKKLLKLPVPDQPSELTLSSEAIDLYREYFAENQLEARSGGRLDDVKAWAGKFRGHILKMAGLIHVMHNAEGIPTMIEVDSIERAYKLWQYHTAHALEVFAETGASEKVRNAKYVFSKLPILFEQGEGTVSAKEIFDRCRKLKTMEELNEVLPILVEHGCLMELVQEGKKIGRPSEMYSINPAILEMPTQNTQNPVPDIVNPVVVNDSAYSAEGNAKIEKEAQASLKVLGL